jgi:hypothetical protein
MNGRVYDPVLGRFLSADPHVDGAYDSQGYNRYSYVGNNPMNATDPSGYWKLKEILPAIIGIVVAVVATVFLGPGGATFWQAFVAGLHSFGAVVGAGAAGGFASGFSGSLLNGGSLGDAFKAGVIGAAWGAATAAVAWGVGQYFDGMYAPGTAASEMSNPLIEGGRALAHGATQGALTEAQGGQFRHGFYAAAFSSAAGSITAGKITGHSGWAITKRTVFSATVGGTASRLGGGKFANGALTAAFQHLFNHEVADFFNNIRRDAQTQGWGWAIYDNLLLPGALGAQAGVVGFNNAVTFGFSGTGGFDPDSQEFQTGRIFGKATMVAEAAVVPMYAWAAAGAPTMTFLVGTGAPTVGRWGIHVIYGTGGAWAHATGTRFFQMTVSPASQTYASLYISRYSPWQFSLPIFNSPAAMQTGQAANTCVTAAASAYARGLKP